MVYILVSVSSMSVDLRNHIKLEFETEASPF